MRNGSVSTDAPREGHVMGPPENSRRVADRARYIDGENSMQTGKIFAPAASSFIYEDPADPEAVSKADLATHMLVWPTNARAHGAAFEFDILDGVVQDWVGELLEWYWWQLTKPLSKDRQSSRLPRRGCCPSA